MQQLLHARLIARSLCLLIAIGATLAAAIPAQTPAQAQAIEQPTSAPAAAPAQPAAGPFLVHVPIVRNNRISPFGVQSTVPLTTPPLMVRAFSLKAAWARVGGVSWRRLQPTEGGPINWSIMADFEQELRALKQAGITAEVYVHDSPRWATINTPFPTSCGAIRADKFGAFANFMRALVARYSTAEFEVRNWELGNEVDVDPTLVPADMVFGCWGNINDPFYGGRHYGEMLKVVTPAIRAANPSAQVWIGGLLLDAPNNPANSPYGRPERFLEGVLEAGAAPYFDVVPYHWYPSYAEKKVDYDNAFGNQWDALGGGVIGKARYLRQLMQRYGVTKPLFLNETSFACPNDSFGSYPWCTTPDAQFYSVQADMLVRMAVRSISEGVSGFIWFTLNPPGWRHGALLDAASNPKPVYYAYYQLTTQLQNAVYAGPAFYHPGVEGYTFRRGAEQVQVLWAKQNQAVTISLPATKFVGAYARSGNPITPAVVGTQRQLAVPFEPVYLIRKP